MGGRLTGQGGKVGGGVYGCGCLFTGYVGAGGNGIVPYGIPLPRYRTADKEIHRI